MNNILEARNDFNIALMGIEIFARHEGFLTKLNDETNAFDCYDYQSEAEQNHKDLEHDLQSVYGLIQSVMDKKSTCDVFGLSQKILDNLMRYVQTCVEYGKFTFNFDSENIDEKRLDTEFTFKIKQHERHLQDLFNHLLLLS